MDELTDSSFHTLSPSMEIWGLLLKGWQDTFLTTRGAFGDWHIWSPNVPAQLGAYVNVFEKI